jgi:hypothetical protein
MVLYRHETYSVTLMEKYRSRIFLKQSADESIWIQKGESNRRLEKFA